MEEAMVEAMVEAMAGKRPVRTTKMNDPTKQNLKTKLKDAIFDVSPVTTRAH